VTLPARRPVLGRADVVTASHQDQRPAVPASPDAAEPVG